MYLVAMIGVLVALALTVVRAIAGPTVFDRILAANVVGTLAVLFVAVLGFLTGRPEWLDVALVYAFLNLIATLTALKFFRHGTLAYDPTEDQK